MKPISELLGDTADLDFEMWWKIYPRKQGKAKVQKAWDKLTPDERGYCYLGTEKHIRGNPQWKNPQYIPMPMTFLNQKRWQDEIVEAKTAVTRVTEEAQGSQTKHDFVWAAMTQMYGESWVKKYGEHPPEIWKKYLNAIEWHRIKRGCRAVLDSGDLMMPSLPLFIRYCARTFGEETTQKQLPSSKKTDTETALKYLDQIQKMLK